VSSCARPDANVQTTKTDLGAVEVARLGAGPPVVLIHGTPGGGTGAGLARLRA
jgi:pimeloyl-ACP methyl ester carboxylesterase